MTQTKRKSKSPPSLSTILKFNADDLAANRDGYMTVNQRSRLQQETRRFVQKHVAFGLSILLFFGCLLVVLFQSASISEINLMTICTLILGITLTLALPGFLFNEALGRRRAVRADLYKGHVEAAEGLVALTIYQRGRYSGLEISVGGETFKAESDVFVAFKNGEPYAVYYAPHSRTLLSAKHLESAD